MKWISQAMLLIASLLLIPATHSQLPVNIEPALRALIATQPDEHVAVIVQKLAASLPLEEQVIRLGGQVTKDLSLINAFVAEIPGHQVAAVAQLAGVRWISLDAPIKDSNCTECVELGRLASVYNRAIGADQLWNQPPYLQGQGIGIAVLDSGIQASHADVAGRIVAGKSIVRSPEPYDGYGHGTIVAGLIAGSGAVQQGRYIGVAPRSHLINVKVTTVTGASTESDVIAGLQWVYENRAAYNIRIVNLSLNASKAQSYHTSPLSAACEVLWFNGVVVVTSAGNRGEGTIYPPANDPFVITVGAVDDLGTPTIADDSVAHFSAYGVTRDGIAKPDLVAPGRYIVGPRAGITLLSILYPENVVDRSYMRISGTSAAAPIVSGAIALLLQNEPNLTPDQVKYRLQKTANRNWAGYEKAKAGAGYLDIAAAVRQPSSASANTGIPVSRLLTSGTNPVSAILDAAMGWQWNSVSWSSVSWSSVSWSSVSWSSVSWSSDYMELMPKLPVLSALAGTGEAGDELINDTEPLEPVMEIVAALESAMAENVAENVAENAPQNTNLLFLPIVQGTD